MIKVLVTGAHGQLGKTIQKLYKTNDDIEFFFMSKKELDITDYNNVTDHFKKSKFKFCINCAAYTNVEQAEKTPEIAYKINAEAVYNLAKVCHQFDVTLIHISTDYVFNGEKETPYTITDIPNPVNEYGKSKLLGEQHIINTLDKYFIIRTSWLYSKEFGKNFYRSILEKAQTEEELSVTTDQVGCPTNTENLSRYIYKLIITKQSNYGIKHFSDNEIMTWYEFAKKILKENNLLNKISVVKTDNYITFAIRPKYSVLSSSE